MNLTHAHDVIEHLDHMDRIILEKVELKEATASSWKATKEIIEL